MIMTNTLSKKYKYLVLAIAAMLVAIFVLILVEEAHAEATIEGLEITNIEVENIDGKSVKVKWQTNYDSTGRVVYGLKKESFVYFIGDSSSARKYHEVILGNLTPKTDYYYQVIAINDSEQTSSFVLKFSTKNFKDTHAVLVSDMEIPYLSGNVVFIKWKTDLPSNSVVEYDNNGTYKTRATGNSNTTEHQVILKNLKPDTKYFVRAYSTDKDGNRSAYLMNYFTTTTKIESGDLAISYLRPSSPTDSYITNKSIQVGFKTNRYAKATVKISAKSFKTRTYNLDWNSSQSLTIPDLTADTEYKIDISATDLLNKKLSTSLTVKTQKSVVVLGISSGNTSTNAGLASYSGTTVLSTGTLKCDANIFKTNGYYGQYFLTSEDTRVSSNRTINDFDWQSADKFRLSRVDSNLDFGKNFYALGSNTRFFAYWRAIIDAPTDGTYTYNLGSDDESWVYFDGAINGKLGSNQGSIGQKTITLTKGPHALEVYFVYRGRSGSKMSFKIDEKVAVYPWPNNCNINEIYKLKGSNVSSGQTSTSTNTGGITTNSNGVKVAGISSAYYSASDILYKTNEAPDIYAIIKGQKHFISSPASFNDYGYSWNSIKTVSRATLAKYPDARLVKLPDQNTIYFLYQRPDNKWLKISLNSPTVFISYPVNFWGNVIEINKYDLDSYPDVRLIKVKNSTEIYFLEDNVRRLVSAEVLKDKGFNPSEVVEINKVHMESYKIGEPLKYE